MSPMTSTKVSLLMSGGQALVPQWTSALVPTRFSTEVLKPSQSGSLTGTVHGGRFCPGFGQLGQLSKASHAPSPSASPKSRTYTSEAPLVSPDTRFVSTDPKAAKRPVSLIKADAPLSPFA